MADFSQRSTEAEIMDDLAYSGKLMDRTLYELEVINKWLGGNDVTLGGIKKLLKHQVNNTPVHIADLGCGRGDMLRLIDGWARSESQTVSLVGIDANPYIINSARENLKHYPHIQFQTINIFSPEFQSQKFDIVIGTLFFHHFADTQLVTFFKQLKGQVRIGFVINDIHRHVLAFYAIKLLTKLFSGSSMLKFDAPLSVLRAFKKSELMDILENAGIENYTIRWRWAFRWQVLVQGSKN
jgi:ubiquinone/menaquinone biosynthesis C-methylase UbiE